MCQNVSSGHYVSSLLPMNSSILHAHVCLLTIQKNRNENELGTEFVEAELTEAELIESDFTETGTY